MWTICSWFGWFSCARKNHGDAKRLSTKAMIGLMIRFSCDASSLISRVLRTTKSTTNTKIILGDVVAFILSDSAS